MTFRMTKCHLLLRDYSEDFSLIQTLVHDIERAVSQNSNAVFCLCYSLVDTTCKTVLDRYDVPNNKMGLA